MTTPTHVPAVGPAPQRLLAWTFRQGSHLLTCELLGTARAETASSPGATTASATRSDYAVIVTPHWAGGAVVVEQLSNGVAAFHRHASLALQLRQQGWSVIAYAPVPSPRSPQAHSHAA